MSKNVGLSVYLGLILSFLFSSSKKVVQVSSPEYIDTSKQVLDSEVKMF